MQDKWYTWWSVLANFIGVKSDSTSHWEKVISGIGGFVGILLILLISQMSLGTGWPGEQGLGAALLVASMGASAVLVFAVPHGALAQPWALIGGHVLSALVGVSCSLWIPDTVLAAALAVGLAILVMHYCGCIHPPGGATALSAVVAGPAVESLGFQFVITPVLLNVLTIFFVAVLFNYLFPWRRYPAALQHYQKASPIEPSTPQPEAMIDRADIEYALRQMNLVLDISNQDLERIYELARSRVKPNFLPQEILLGHFYSNGEYGDEWSVRRVVDESGTLGEQDQVIYKVVAGKDRRTTGVIKRGEFAKWARHEVYLQESSWCRVPLQ